MANTNLVALTQQDFGNLYKIFPPGGLSRGLPAEGTGGQYRYIQRLEIAILDMTAAVDFMETYITTEVARVRATGTTVTRGMRSTLRTACLNALLAAWNASNHMAPGAGLSSFNVARWCKEKLCPGKWPTDRTRKIEEIVAAGTQNPAPAAMQQIPQF